MGELERSLTHREFLEWQVLHRIHPFGLLHDDARLAVLTTVVANLLRSDKQGALMPWDLMSWIPKPEEPKASHERSLEEVSNNFLNMFFPPQRANNAPKPQLPE